MPCRGAGDVGWKSGIPELFHDESRYLGVGLFVSVDFLALTEDGLDRRLDFGVGHLLVWLFGHDFLHVLGFGHWKAS